MQAFTIEWQPSRVGKTAVWVLHGAAVFVCLGWFRGIGLFLGMILLMASAYWAWQQQNLLAKTAIAALEVDEQGYAAVRLVHERNWVEGIVTGKDGSKSKRSQQSASWLILTLLIYQPLINTGT